MIDANESLTDVRFREALALHRDSRFAEAAAAYEQVLGRQPRHVQALTFLSVIAFQAEQFERAVELANRALQIEPKSAATHLIRAHSLLQLGQNAAAVAAYDHALETNPDLAEAHVHRGNALQLLGRHEEALSSYDKALELNPRLAEVHNNRGLAQQALKRFDAALASFDQAIAIDPEYGEAFYSRGGVLRELRQSEAALASYDRAIEIKGDYAQAWSDRGNLLSELERFDEALASYDSAVAQLATFADAHCNRGNLLVDLARYVEALACFDRALAIDDEHALAHVSRSFVYLLLGDLQRGWRDFEWRWRNEHGITSREKRHFPQPPWLGEEPLEGKTVLVHCEQGLGDTIQFCRYVKLLAERGAKVILEAPTPLYRLLSTLQGVTHLVRPGEALPAFDYYCPLMSLPLALETTLETIPAPSRYLEADPERARHWKQTLGPKTQLRVGLVWSGGFRPTQPELWPVNNRRNIPLRELAPLNIAGVEFFSLQKGEAAEAELATLEASGWDGPTLVNHTAELRDFQETAALIEQMDLVISVDTSTAHLAGALGKPVWILNRFDTCWRWLLDRIDSPWYPTVRLYRQECRGDWHGVVQRVRSDLEQLAGAVRT